MKPFRVIPAMDLIEGQCVRLVQGDFSAKTTYPINPVELAKRFLDVGLDLVHIVDLEGAFKGKPQNLATVESVASTGVQIELGGGLRTANHIQQAIDCGVTEVILGSTLFTSEKHLKTWSEQFPGIFVAGIDARKGKVAVHGWTSNTYLSATKLVSTIENLNLFNRVIYTDITRDGTLKGPNLDQLIEISQWTSLPVIASGGIRSIQDITAIKELENIGIKGVIIGKAFYDNRITLEEMAEC